MTNDDVNDINLYDFWVEATKYNFAFIRTLNDDSAQQLNTVLYHLIKISLECKRPALTREGNIICLKVSHLLRLFYDRCLTFEGLWFRLDEFVCRICGNCTHAALYRALPVLIYETPSVSVPMPTLRPRPVPVPVPTQRPSSQLVYDELMDELDREDAVAARSINRRKTKRQHRARRKCGIEPPAYSNAIESSHSGCELDTPPPPHA